METEKDTRSSPGYSYINRPTFSRVQTCLNYGRKTLSIEKSWWIESVVGNEMKRGGERNRGGGGERDGLDLEALEDHVFLR